MGLNFYNKYIGNTAAKTSLKQSPLHNLVVQKQTLFYLMEYIYFHIHRRVDILSQQGQYYNMPLPYSRLLHPQNKHSKTTNSTKQYHTFNICISKKYKTQPNPHSIHKNIGIGIFVSNIY